MNQSVWTQKSIELYLMQLHMSFMTIGLPGFPALCHLFLFMLRGLPGCILNPLQS